MRIGIDIDEVLTPLLESFLPFYNERHGTSYTPTDCGTYYLEFVFERPLVEVKEDVRAFYESGQLDELEPFPEAKPALEKLKAKGHELFVITSRFGAAMDVTPPWIEKHFPGLFTEIFFTRHVDWKNKKLSKAELCAEEKIDVLIEDDDRYVEECKEHKIPLLLLDKPWNQKAKADRVYSWEEIVEKIEK